MQKSIGRKNKKIRPIKICRTKKQKNSFYKFFIKKYDLICFYSDNDPYVKYEVEKDFADTVATEQVLVPNGVHINSESGYDTFEDIVSYL